MGDLISCTVCLEACVIGQRKSNVLLEYLKRDTFWCAVQGLQELMCLTTGFDLFTFYMVSENSSFLKLSNPCISEQCTLFYFTYRMCNMNYINDRGVSPTCFSTATTKLLHTEELVNYSSLVSIGFKTGILFCLEIVDFY